MTVHKFAGKFGMCEMELAAEKIIDMLGDKPYSNYFGIIGQQICVDSFKHDSCLLVGFCHLLSSRLIIPSYPNSMFTVTPEFLERCKCD